MNLFLRKTEARHAPNRRDFLIQSTCASLGITSLVNTLSQLQMIGAASAAEADDYKALVCVFLNGGMDSNNLLIPAGSSTARTEYLAGRGYLGIADSNFDYTPANAANGYNGSTAAVSSRITPQNAGAYDPVNRTAGYTANSMALHPGAYPLAQMFESGDLAFLANIGTLVGTQTVTRTNFNSIAPSAKPAQLFSHSDQQVQWQSSLPDRPFTSGWGGRMADLLAGMNQGDLALSVSIAGVNSFQVGLSEKPYFMNSSGSVSSLTGFGSPYSTALRSTALQPDYSNPSGAPAAGKYNPLAPLSGGADPLIGTNYQHNAAGWRMRAVEQILAMSHANLFDSSYVDVPQNARITEGLVGSALAVTANGTASTMDAHFTNWFPSGLFNPQLPDFANQMRVVSRVIAGRSTLNNKRQIFFVQLGGWDTHTSQIPGTTNAGHYGLVNQLSRGIRAFKDAMESIGMWDKVMLFSASDFNRTMIANKSDSSAGSDHAWGGHAFLAGGAVNGRKIYGKFPDLTRGGGIDCTGSSGRWIPSTSVDQFASVIAKWFGVSDNQLSTVFPNLGRFMPNGIGNSELVSRNLDMIDYTV